MQKRYNIYYSGEVLEGHILEAVRAQLARLFKADKPTLDKLFSGDKQLLKRNCDRATALKYKAAMERAGARPVITACSVDQAPAEPTARPPERQTAADRIAALAAAADAAEAAEADHSNPDTKPIGQPAQGIEFEAGLGLAPTGTPVLVENERAPVHQADIDTSMLQLDGTAARLSQESPPPPPPPDTSHLGLSDAGETIPNLPAQHAPVSPNTDGINLSPSGTDFSDCAPAPHDAPQLDLSALNVAAVGSEVLEEKYRKTVSSVAPSTEHLSLDD